MPRFRVTIHRVSRAEAKFEVDAPDPSTAGCEAVKLARNHNFSGRDFDAGYEVKYVEDADGRIVQDIDADTCDECGAVYPDDADRHFGPWHAESCSLHQEA